MEFCGLNETFIMNYQNYFRFLFWTIALILCSYIYLKRKRYNFSSSKIPSLKLRFWYVFGHLQLSSLHRFRANRLPHSHHVDDLQGVLGMVEIFRKSGSLLIWQAWTPCVLAFRADIVKTILNHSTELRKGWMYKFSEDWLGTGLLTSEGEKWKQRRKLLTPTFHFDILKDFLPGLNHQSQILIKILQKEAEKPWIDIVPYLTRCSLDIICETTLGVTVKSQTNSQSEYVKAILTLSNLIFLRSVSPWYWPSWMFRLSTYGKQFYKNVEIVHKFTRKIIAQKKMEKSHEKMESQDLETKTDHVYRHREKRALLDFLIEDHLKNQTISEEDIREEIDTFTFEGHDTTSMGLSWAVYQLGLHPEIQEKLHEELELIFGEDQERSITMEDLAEMKYLESILKETLRLYPSVPFISRDLIEETEIRGQLFPKGTTCGVFTYALHRDPEIFPNPEKFDPDRFLPGSCENRDAFAYVPFSAGPRNCIGQRFAMLELKTVVASLCRNFHIQSLDPRDKVHTIINIVLRADSSIRIKLKKRKL